MASGIGSVEGEVKGHDRCRWADHTSRGDTDTIWPDGGDSGSTAKDRGRARRLALSLLLLVASCEYPNDAVVVENRSSQTFILVEEFRGDRIGEGHELGPSEIYQTRQECVDGDFIVESLEGEELARRRGPFCQGDPPWVVDDGLLGTG
jgi:hypothetical protein